MKQFKFKRILPFAMALMLLFAVGCAKAPVPEKTEQAAPETVSIGGEAEETNTANVDHSSLYAVDGSTETSDNESYASDTANVNAVLVQKLGVLTMTSADINKSGDSTGDFSGGQNAAVAVISKGQLTLSQSNITTNGIGAVGMIVSAEGTQLTVTDISVYTSGESSPAVIVRDDASAMISSGTLSTEGADSPAILLMGGRLTLTGVTITSKSGDLIRVLGGYNFLTLDNTAITAMPALPEGATLMLRLQNGASFGGTLGGSVPAKASVTLDATSKLTLTAETYVAGFVNADLTHANIQSNGFNLYYDSSVAENAYLEGQSFALPGGGFLAPII